MKYIPLGIAILVIITAVLTSSIVINAHINVYAIKFFNSLPLYKIVLQPQSITLTPGKSAIIKVYITPGQNVSAASLTFVLSNSSIASISIMKGELNGYMKCNEYHSGTSLIMKCALVSFNRCSKLMCNVFNVKVTAKVVGTAKLEVKGTVGLYTGSVYNLLPAIETIIVRSQPVSATKCVVILKPEYRTTTVGQTDTVHIYLKNCSDAAAVQIEISYNTYLAKVVKVVPGPFKELVEGLFTYSIKEGKVSIGIAGYKPCNSKNVLVADIILNMTHMGTLSLTGIAKVALPGGQLLVVPVNSTIIEITKYVECDLNMNHRLDIGDVVLVIKKALGLINNPVPCDLNHNGYTDIGDAVLLLKKVLGIS